MKNNKFLFTLIFVLSLTGCNIIPINTSSSTSDTIYTTSTDEGTSLTSDNTSVLTSESTISLTSDPTSTTLVSITSESTSSGTSDKPSSSSSIPTSTPAPTSTPSSSSVTPAPSSSSSSPSSSSSKTSTSSSTPHSSLWNLNYDLRGVSFRDALASEIIKKGNKKTSYSSCLSIGAEAAKYGNSGKFVPFYHSTDTLATTGSCNREHVWPNSRGGGTKAGGGQIEQDPYCIRPTLNSDNSSRSNYFYGTNGTKNKEWDPASCGFMGARGESARVVLYIATKYGKSNNLVLTNNPDDDWNNIRSMGRLDRLIEWNKQYPVTDIEKQINDYLEQKGYGRNPFVDDPNIADYIWTTSGYATSNDSINFIPDASLPLSYYF